MRRQGQGGVGLLVAVVLFLPQVCTALELVDETHQRITRAVHFLSQAQQPDGSFGIYRCWNEAMTDCSHGVGADVGADPAAYTHFSRRQDAPVLQSSGTVVVLTGLLGSHDPDAAPLIEKASRWLRAQMDAQGLFGGGRMLMPHLGPQCPGEFRSLYQTVPSRVVLENLGISLPPLLPTLFTFQRRDGTFSYYLFPPEEAEAIRSGEMTQGRFRERYSRLLKSYGTRLREYVDFVDPVTNALVLDYLVQHGQPSSALCDYLVRNSQQEELPENPVVVHTTYHLAYAVSRSYAHGGTCLESAKAALLPRLLRKQWPDGSWDNPFDTALAAISLMNFGYAGTALDRAIGSLLSQQQPNGSWKRAIQLVVMVEPTRVWLGSEAVSTGQVLEALGQYLKVRQTTSL